jgi:hypothetical protein
MCRLSMAPTLPGCRCRDQGTVRRPPDGEPTDGRRLVAVVLTPSHDGAASASGCLAAGPRGFEPQAELSGDAPSPEPHAAPPPAGLQTPGQRGWQSSMPMKRSPSKWRHPLPPPAATMLMSVDVSCASAGTWRTNLAIHEALEAVRATRHRDVRRRPSYPVHRRATPSQRPTAAPRRPPASSTPNDSRTSRRSSPTTATAASLGSSGQSQGPRFHAFMAADVGLRADRAQLRSC